jgi:hypothetical protein
MRKGKRETVRKRLHYMEFRNKRRKRERKQERGKTGATRKRLEGEEEGIFYCRGRGGGVRGGRVK